jgi:hypothetical protein
MRVRTDDDVYRVDAVWLGPPKATFPWRARYVAWGIGIVVFFLVLGTERWLGIGFGFFSVAWGVIVTVVITRVVGGRISHERPLGAVVAMWYHELTTPREKTGSTGGAAGAGKIRVNAPRPRPRRKPRGPQSRGAAPPREAMARSRRQASKQPAFGPPRRSTSQPAPREDDGVRTPART